MNDPDPLLTIPVGSIILLSKEESATYAKQMLLLPTALRETLASSRTGAFIRGLAKSFDVPVEKSPVIAFQVLQVGLGEKTLAQLPSLLSTELQLANDQAQKMAQEIEKELFVPIMLEYNQYLAQQKKSATSAVKTSSPQASGARNVLDLKNQPRPPVPPAIPRR